jgi:valyl-tRNA synthetase
VVRAIRNLRTEKKIAPGKKIPAIFIGGENAPLLTGESSVIAALGALDLQKTQIVKELAEKPQGQAAVVISGIEIYLTEAAIENVEAELARLQKELEETQAQIERLESLLASPFAQRAPAAVVEKERQKLSAYQDTAAKLRNQLEAIR